MARISFRGGVCFGGVLACLVGACAASPRSPAPAQEPAATAAPGDAAESRAAQKSAVAPAAPPRANEPAPAPPAAGPAPARPPSVEVGSASAGQSISQEFTRRVPVGAEDPHGASGARVRLAEARRELEIAANERDCARACRALESMERAAQQVCELARSADERRECTSAGDQVDKARSKVQSVCGACPQKPR
jgi:hypothetical protein